MSVKFGLPAAIGRQRTKTIYCMSSTTNRRNFIRMATLSGIGFQLTKSMSSLAANLSPVTVNGAAPALLTGSPAARLFQAGGPFVPYRAASWWCSIEDLQWPQKHVVDKIKRRADGFAKAGIDTAINFGFHNRFDFSNYFHQLHGYYANICEELHQRNIRFMDHYSCNHVTRPRTEDEFRFVNKYERMGVLLIPDARGAAIAQYEGHLYQDLCEVDLRDGSRGYARQYQYEAFCHNNPGLHDMHGKYLQRLMKEVPFDGIEVDDMCSYPGNTTCGCKYCRDRFRRDYGHEIPAFTDSSFFGDTRKPMLQWGNYANPVYRDWLRMKADSIRDHVKQMKEILGDKPLMTCCSNTGPIVLNAVALDLEKMAPWLDLFMLENVGTNISNANWIDMDAEAMHQKDIAFRKGNAPAIALSYELSEKGAFLGWALARFWGVANWSSTLNGRLEEDPPHALTMEEAIGPSNNWELRNSPLDFRQGQDVVEVRLVNNSYCRENGWLDANGHEHWDHAKAWSIQLVQQHVGYRFVRRAELEDANALLAESTPLVLDGVGCVSDKQFAAISRYLAGGGTAWLALPFGTHDERGYPRKKPLSDELLRHHYKNLTKIESAISSSPLASLIAKGRFSPIIRQVKGDPRWVCKLRIYEGKPVFHFMNTGLRAIPEEIKDFFGEPLMKDLVSEVWNNDCVFEVRYNAQAVLAGLPDTKAVPDFSLLSPEWGDSGKKIAAGKIPDGGYSLPVNLEGVQIYAVVQ